jgi:hypothetical protein
MRRIIRGILIVSPKVDGGAVVEGMRIFEGAAFDRDVIAGDIIDVKATSPAPSSPTLFPLIPSRIAEQGDRGLQSNTGEVELVV